MVARANQSSSLGALFGLHPAASAATKDASRAFRSGRVKWERPCGLVYPCACCVMVAPLGAANLKGARNTARKQIWRRRREAATARPSTRLCVCKGSKKCFTGNAFLVNQPIKFWMLVSMPSSGCMPRNGQPSNALTHAHIRTLPHPRRRSQPGARSQPVMASSDAAAAAVMDVDGEAPPPFVFEAPLYPASHKVRLRRKLRIHRCSLGSHNPT